VVFAYDLEDAYDEGYLLISGNADVSNFGDFLLHRLLRSSSLVGGVRCSFVLCSEYTLGQRESSDRGGIDTSIKIGS